MNHLPFHLYSQMKPPRQFFTPLAAGAPRLSKSRLVQALLDDAVKTTADQTFVLTAGGHNVGIVNPPGQPKSSHRIRHWKHLDRLLTPDEWLADTHAVPGSWWTPWLAPMPRVVSSARR